MSQDQPTAAFLVIGDEILSGRTQDVNVSYLSKALGTKGVALKEVRIVSDEQEDIVAAVNALRGRYEYVFTSGGIGPTHDDITADSIAAAFGVSIDVREDARAIMAEYYATKGQDMNAARLRMARIPEEAELIVNGVSGAPGFRLGNVHVMAGVPRIFAMMVDAVLPTLRGGPVVHSITVRVPKPEGNFADLLNEVVAAHPGVNIGSYPFKEGNVFGAALVARSADLTALAAAEKALEEIAERL